jgi:hypothetical protein
MSDDETLIGWLFEHFSPMEREKCRGCIFAGCDSNIEQAL